MPDNNGWLLALPPTTSSHPTACYGLALYFQGRFWRGSLLADCSRKRLTYLLSPIDDWREPLWNAGDVTRMNAMSIDTDIQSNVPRTPFWHILQTLPPGNETGGKRAQPLKEWHVTGHDKDWLESTGSKTAGRFCFPGAVSHAYSHCNTLAREKTHQPVPWQFQGQPWKVKKWVVAQFLEMPASSPNNWNNLPTD